MRRVQLREAIASHVSFARAVACGADDVVVTSGAQQAFDLIARVLVTPGKTVVAVEDPGYPPLRHAFAAAGARLVPVPVDDEGMQVDQLPAGARVICVTPSHQFPLGATLSLARRRALLAFARRHGAVVVEDDYDGEFRHGGRPLDALQTLDQDQLVWYVGTFSRSLFPGLRLGYAVVPPWARDAVVAAGQYTDWHSALLAQDTLAAFMAEGHLARHIRKMRAAYTGRRDRCWPRWRATAPGASPPCRRRRPAPRDTVAPPGGRCPRAGASRCGRRHPRAAAGRTGAHAGARRRCAGLRHDPRRACRCRDPDGWPPCCAEARAHSARVLLPPFFQAARKNYRGRTRQRRRGAPLRRARRRHGHCACHAFRSAFRKGAQHANPVSQQSRRGHRRFRRGRRSRPGSDGGIQPGRYQGVLVRRRTCGQDLRDHA
ncbi:PLP-dependent aminotransferase family protein [Cupriavidus necator]|uniref:aminotransferase-like domain-containing protein n=1 Tax=Cupriavidus necator TaxID=106590 RepID=UPI000A47B7DB|nr:PLP-dependent aminotransferase family protein [Cupriavidus necator]